MSLFEPTFTLTPHAYPWAYEAFMVCCTHPWVHTEVGMSGDASDFANLPEADQYAIQRILQGFAQLELRVQDYWSDVVARQIKAFDVVAMARQFGAQESVHAHAYNYLQASLGLPIDADFLKLSEVSDKLGLFGDNCPADQLGKSIALFSGAGEGVSLFGSFAILLSYGMSGGLMKGLAQILSWSIRDENLHCNSGIRLYHQLVEEKPEQAILADEIYSYFDAVLDNELSFVASAFALAEQNQLLNISLFEIEAFLKLKANQRLKALGFDGEHYTFDNQLAYAIEEWFVPISAGTTYQDFFSHQHNGSAYSANAGAKLGELEQAKLASMF